MASVFYDSAGDDEARGNINYAVDTFKAMLVGPGYVPNAATHTKRSDITDEVTGAGYTPDGAIVTATIILDTANHRIDISFSAPSWPNSTITNAQGLVIYKSRGGAAALDELVSYVDFGTLVSTVATTFNISFTQPLRRQHA